MEKVIIELPDGKKIELEIKVLEETPVKIKAYGRIYFVRPMPLKKDGTRSLIMN